MMKSIKDYSLNNKKVIIRCDFNVPINNNKISDSTRIVKALPTIKYAVDNNAKVILMSHLGKVTKEEDKEKNSLILVKEELAKLLNKNILFSKNIEGPSLEEVIDKMKPKDVLLIENTRFSDIPIKRESACDPSLSKYWASLADIFINDAFGTLHREHASNVGISNFLPSAIGFLVEEELTNLEKVKNPEHPFTVIMGGAKISDKLELIKHLVDKCDYLLVGGAMAFTFLKSKGYEVGNSLVEDDMLKECKSLLKKYDSKIILPIDFSTSKDEDSASYKNTYIYEFLKDDIGFDIGKDTIKLFNNIINNSKTVFWNGPLGLVEKEEYKKGSFGVLDNLSQQKVTSILGGGDIVSFATNEKYEDKLSFLSTGGGATLNYLAGLPLPGLKNIKEK